MQCSQRALGSCSTAHSATAPVPIVSRRRSVAVRMAPSSASVSIDESMPPSAKHTTATQFLRPHLLKLAAYTPIEPFEILSARYGRKPDDIIKLDANENPYGPPPEVRQALGNMPFPHIYPDPESRTLRKALAQMHNIPMEHLLVRAAGLARHAAAKHLQAHTLPACPCCCPDVCVCTHVEPLPKDCMCACKCTTRA